jgi:uncharacterized damage-inducible protein DinB
VRPAEILEQLAYNRWANHTMLESLEQLTPERFTRHLGSSFPSIHATVVHILSSEWLWAQRFGGTSPQRRLDPAEYPDLGSIRRLWREVETAHAAFATGLTEAALDETFAYVNPTGERWEYRLWQVFAQLVGHSAYHRGQVTTMLRQVGGRPEETDVLTFSDQGAPEPAVAG